MDNIMDKIERWKLLADVFVDNNTRVFLKKINGDFHFCIIILNGENAIEVENFAPEQRVGKRERIYWFEVEQFEEYEDKRGKE
jgi:hypothetical protein